MASDSRKASAGRLTGRGYARRSRRRVREQAVRTRPRGGHRSAGRLRRGRREPHGVNPNLANHQGDSLVMLAAYHGHAATVAALLAHGADPNRPNDRGQTPLAGAVFKDEPHVISALVAGGADPRAGRPSAVATAQMFERPDLLALLPSS